MKKKNIKEIRMKKFEPIPDGHEGKWVAWVNYKFVASADTEKGLNKRLRNKKEKAVIFYVPKDILIV